MLSNDKKICSSFERVEMNENIRELVSPFQKITLNEKAAMPIFKAQF